MNGQEQIRPPVAFPKVPAKLPLPPTDELFRLWVEAAPDGIVIVDRSGLIQFVNGRTRALFGYSDAELLGQPVED